MAKKKRRELLIQRWVIRVGPIFEQSSDFEIRMLDRLINHPELEESEKYRVLSEAISYLAETLRAERKRDRAINRKVARANAKSLAPEPDDFIIGDKE